MSYSSPFPLQQAFYGALVADGILMGMVSGIYDHVPQDTAYPFVTIGEAQVRDLSNLLRQGTQQQLALRIYSRESGRKQTADIMARIVEVIHAAAPSVTGQELLSLRFTGSSITLENDGATYKGTLNFRALLTEN